VSDRAIDLVHSHDYKTDALALMLARSTGVIPLATAHGWAGDTRRETLFYYPLNKWMLARFPTVVAVSRPIRESIIKAGGEPERVIVLQNAIDSDLYSRRPGRREEIRATLGIEPGDFVVGGVGRLHRIKRFDLVIEAAAALLPRFPQLRLVIVGDGRLRQDLETHASLKLAQRCSLLGQRGDLIDLYQAFDVFIQASDSEGSPNAVLEAMAMEVPIVATDVGGTTDLVTPDQHAIIIPKDNVRRLTEGIERVIQDPEGARARANAARRRVETELSFIARTRRLEDIYCRMAQRQGGLKGRGHAETDA
jgi:glycosyltransferase involved in cell wall biosynthesis